jgi:hypothetical protein
MSAHSTKAWMQRNKLKAIIVYCHEMVFERVQAAATASGCSKGNWVHRVIVERLRQHPKQ